jgi:UDP-3-O-[3-hydroxymyristoyl] glucosamine N-acyltransferase
VERDRTVADVYRLRELAERVGGTVRGDPEREIRGIATLGDAGPDQLSFLTNPRYRAEAETTAAGALLVGPGSGLEGRDLLEAPEPYLAFARLLELFHPPDERPTGISPAASVGSGADLGESVTIGPFAVVEDGASIGDGVVVGPGCVIERGCAVGDGTVLRPRVVLYAGTRVGRRCLIHSGVVLGGDGFGFATSAGEHHKVPQLGRVVVEDDVELGANTTVDRGTLGDTVIERGTKIDNLVMIAHGVRIGERSLLAAQSGIAGSTTVGPRATFAGQAGAAGHLDIAEGAVVAAKSAVLEDLPEGSFVAGIPAVDHRRWKRAQVVFKKLPELRAAVRELRKRVAELEQALGRKEEADS